MTAKSELEVPLLRYYWGYDENDMAMMADAFTEDAVHTISANVLSAGDWDAQPKVRRGRAEIVAQLTASRADFAARGQIPRHVIANVLVEKDAPPEARLRSMYILYIQSAVDGTVLIGISTQVDELTQDLHGAWRIRSHELINSHTGGYDRITGGRLERYAKRPGRS